jgi:nitrogen regulatory protein P-II 1
MDLLDHRHDLIVTIVPKGEAEKALRASQQAGAEGGTIMYGRGAGIHEHRKILGVAIEPEKEILLTAVPRELTQTVLAAIVAASGLDAPGGGVAFVLPLGQVAGICHSGSPLQGPGGFPCEAD